MWWQQLQDDAYPSIEDYGVIGDLRTAAMVAPCGSMDALGFPAFDTPSVFAAPVDRRRGDDGVVFAEQPTGGLSLRLRADVPLRLEDDAAVSEFELGPGQTAWFVLKEAPVPRWLSTLCVIEVRLVTDSLVYRYRVGEVFPDPLHGGEGTFSICSMWYIECGSRPGDVHKARYLFEKMLTYANPLGFFSEQLGYDGQFLGNIPQAFTHLALISTAFDLNRRLAASGIPG